MKAEDIKPIPKNIAKKIRKIDEQEYHERGRSRFYSYLTTIKGELVKITVACRTYKDQWFCKQVAVHGLHSEDCLCRDIEYCLLGYSVGWYQEGLTAEPKRYEDGRWYQAKDKYYDPASILVNKNFVLTLDKYKYSAVDKYPYNYQLFKYLRVYEEYPQAEYLVKVGLPNLATNKEILKKVAKDKNFRKWIIKYAHILRNDLGNYPYFSAKEILTAYKNNMPLLEEKYWDRKIRILKKEYYFENVICRVITQAEIRTFIKYREKNNINLSSYADYVKACLYIGLDMTQEKNLYPHDFKKWHDIRIDQFHTLKAERDAEEKRALYEKFAQVADKYTPLQRDKEDTYIVVIAKSPQDLIKEGVTLHHCVGRMNYDQKFAKEQSLIFFVRNASEPDTPFVTMEYSLDEKRILQCYGENDHKPSATVLEYVNKTWLPYANRKLKKIAA